MGGYYGGKWHEVVFFCFPSCRCPYDSVLYNTQLQEKQIL